MKLAIGIVTLLLGLAACRDSVRADDQADALGTVVVNLEPIEGRFVEGFEAGLRFETAAGRVIATALWSDDVRSQGLLEQEVPTGVVVVLATVTIGPGGPPAVPDVDGELDCRLEVDVDPGGRTFVELGFDSTSGDCLHEKGRA